MNYFLKKKKWMAWVVLLTFLFTSFMPSNLLAGNSVAEAAGDDTEAKIEQQITHGGDTLQIKDGEPLSAGSTEAPDAIIQKSITAGNNENEFNITLQVKTPENLETIPSSADAAVVLVMDVSGSMVNRVGTVNCRNNGKHHIHTDACYTDSTIRIDAARSAAKTFVRAFSGSRVNPTDKRLVSVVAFSSNATTKLGWTNVVSSSDTGTNLDETLNWFKRDNATGGTNMEGGLQLAMNLINAGTAEGGALTGIDNVTVILLTDGCPTRHIPKNNRYKSNSENWSDLPEGVDHNRYNTETILGEYGGGDWAKKVDYEPVGDIADTIKTTQINGSVISLKTIALSTGTDSFEGIGNNVNLAEWLGDNVSTTYSASSAASLVESFTQINTLIALGTQAWLVKDPMAANIIYATNKRNSASTDANSYTVVSRTREDGTTYDMLQWDLKRSQCGEPEVINGTKWYTYELTYPIRLDNTTNDDNITSNKSVATNDTTTLDYFMFSRVNEGEQVAISDMKQATFDVPKVKGNVGSLNLTKTALDDAIGLGGATFALQYLCSNHNGNSRSNVPSGTTSTVDSTKGKLTLNNIPSGHIYKLVETQPPEGYEAAPEAKYAVKVEFGKAYYCELDNGALPKEVSWTEVPLVGLALSNPKASGETEISVVKNWVIPNEVTETPAIQLELFQDGEPFALDTEKYVQASDVSVTVEKGHTYINLAPQSNARVETKVKVPQYKANGSEYQYTVRQEIVNEVTPVTGGTVDIQGKKWNVAIDDLTVTNTYIGETSIPISKVWVDGGVESKRPEKITVSVSNGSTVVATQDITAETNWKYTFENLPKYDASGAEITYTVTEAEVEGYETTSIENGVITNTISDINDKISIPISKVWVDGGVESKRPEKITVSVSNGNTVVATQDITAETNWKYTFENLPKYDASGAEITYTVTEAEVEGYETTSIENGVITNTISDINDKISIPISKVWVDGGVESKRPEKITVSVSNGSTVVATQDITAETNWKYTFENLPKYDASGAEITYTVTEAEVEGYETTSIENGVITNTISDINDKISIPISKVWVDGGVESKRPEKITVSVSNGNTVVATQDITAETNWKYTFENLPKYDASGAEITYTVTEAEVEGYETTSIENGVITNTISDINDKISIPISKVWVDGGVESKRPEKITVSVSNGSTVVATQDITAETNWKYTFENLPKYDASGAEITYTVTEAEVEGYETTSIENGVITNTISDINDKISIPISKVWVDGGVESKRPEKITVSVSNGSTVVATQDITAETNWKYTFENLPKYDASGAEITYTVTEAEVEGYETTSIENGVITNTISDINDKISIPISKVWVDGGVESKRPEKITVSVSNGSTVVATQDITAETNWKYTFENLPKYDASGAEITYTVTEAEVEGYETTSIENGVITNTISDINDKISIPISKVWVDGGVESKRPEKITVSVSNGSTVVATQDITAETNWTYTFENLPKYDVSGAEITYTVTEAEVEGYETTSIENGVITNTISDINDKISIPISKVWVDGGVESKRPEKITVSVSNGSTVVATQDITAETNWTYTFENLPKYDVSGAEITYTVTEAEVEGYETTSIENGVITNTIEQEIVTISGTKSWNVPEDIEVPDQIEVQLFRDEEYVKTTTATALDWTYSFDNLPKYAVDGDGHAYIYTVKEVPVAGFTASYNGFDIINTYNRDAVTSVHVEKVWNDFSTNVGAHPDITIQLYQGELLYDTVILGNGTLTADFENLPKYDANQEAYEYTVKEVPVNGYISTVEQTANGFVITNTLQMAEAGKVTVGKTATGDNKPGDDTKYKFELQIQVVRPEGSNVLFDARALSEVTLGDAANTLNEAIDAVEASVMMTTSASQYQYVLTEKVDMFDTQATALMGVGYGSSSPSALIFAENERFAVEQSDVDSMLQSELTDSVMQTLLQLCKDSTIVDVAELLAKLAEEVPMPDEEENVYTFAMDKAAVEKLVEAARFYNELAGQVSTPEASDAPSALQVFLNGSSTPSTLTFVENGGAGDYYKVDFWLASGANAMFDIKATSGSEIYYRIVESFDEQTSANYSYTSIFDALAKQTTSGTAIDFTLFDADAAMAYTFTNVYTNNTSGGGEEPNPEPDPEPWTPDPEVPIDDPDVPLAEPDVTDVTEPTEPDIEIDDPDVPLSDVPGEPVEIKDPQVPLSDAPQTGDTNNAIPFVVLMMVAGLGLVITRKRFN